MRNVPSLHPIPSQTGLNPWQIQCPSAYPQRSPAVLGHHETVQLVTQRAREALNDQRETALCASLRRAVENFPLPLISTKRLLGKILSVLGQELVRRVRQLEQEADARFS